MERPDQRRNYESRYNQDQQRQYGHESDNERFHNNDYVRQYNRQENSQRREYYRDDQNYKRENNSRDSSGDRYRENRYQSDEDERRNIRSRSPTPYGERNNHKEEQRRVTSEVEKALRNRDKGNTSRSPSRERDRSGPSPYKKENNARKMGKRSSSPKTTLITKQEEDNEYLNLFTLIPN